MVVAAGGVLGLADFCLRAYGDPKEPPYVPARIPLIGHVIGLLTHGTSYYNQIRSVI